MRQRSSFFVSILLLACLPASALAQSDEAAVRAAFDGYVAALEARDGSAAAERVTADTIGFYEECRRAALTMPRDELQGRDFIFRYTTLSLRHEIDAARLGSMDGRAVFARAVDEGQVGANIAQMRVERVSIRGGRAQLHMRTPSGGQAPLGMRREGGRWRIELGRLIRLTGPAVAQLAGRLGGGDEDAGLTQMLGRASGSPVSASIWQPLRSGR